ncbi:leukemia inhibitory factor receptor-like [Megalops cyprinoides]|uniref:leukemia inhibitory factor receptor-like n=1 Tax=Megalops cyprinoides TaxID=118141 RepID=UPI0018647B4B|nr:leukemia inhibitory factor receptor-like [Megalops cyprinoides]
MKVDPEWTLQRISVTWRDDLDFTKNINGKFYYEIEVLHTETYHVQHHEAIEVRPDQVGKVHHWNWTSPIPLECTSHSVRVRSQHQGRSSPWTPLQTIPGKDVSSHKHMQVFPKDRVITPGSSLMFCCILREGHELNTIDYDIIGKTSIHLNATQISNRTYAVDIIEHNQKPSESAGNDVFCSSTAEDGTQGATVFVGYPPDDQDFVCETDLVSVECQWNQGRPTYLVGKHRTQYTLNGRRCEEAESGGPVRHCKWTMNGKQEEMTWNLTAKNQLGSVELTDTADLMHRLHLQAPSDVATEVHARNATVKWKWNVTEYQKLPLVCQLQLNSSMEHYTGKGVSLVLLKDLLPDTTYSLKVHCGSDQNFWKWSSWSSVHVFHTKEDCPNAPDVWIQMDSNYTGLVMWKRLSKSESHGQILGYEVTLGSSMKRETEKSTVACSVDCGPPGHCSAPFRLGDGGDRIVTVKALNSAGSSPPASITVPRLVSDDEVTVLLVSGSSGHFDLSWPPGASATCGYIVEWYPTHIRRNCSFNWMKVPVGNTSTTIQSGTFEPGERYSFSVYACTPGAPEPLARMQGYAKELAPAEAVKNLTAEQHGSKILLQWEGIPLEKQNGFIQGYYVYIKNGYHLISTENITEVDAKSYTLRNLLYGGVYDVTVKAYTLGGEDEGATAVIKFDPPTDWLIVGTFTTSAALTCILILIIVSCYWKRKWVKEKIYPEIPKPRLPDEFFKSHGLLDIRTLDVNPCPYSKVQVMENPLDKLGDVILVEDGDGYHPIDTDTSGPIVLKSYSQLGNDLQKPVNSSSDSSSGSYGSIQTDITYTRLQCPTVYSSLSSPQGTLPSDVYRPQETMSCPRQPQGVPRDLYLHGDSGGYQPQSTQPPLSPVTGGLDSSMSSPTSVNSFTLLLHNPALENASGRAPSLSSSPAWLQNLLPHK